MEYFLTHPALNNPNFSKVYATYRRITHHSNYLACLFAIEDFFIRGSFVTTEPNLQIRRLRSAIGNQIQRQCSW